MNTKVIGIGGIGCHLVPTLARFLAYTLPDASLTLIDGDRFEERNSSRQPFTRLGNKADVTCESVEREHPSLHVSSRDEYVSGENAPMLIREGDVVLLCVDNHATRKLVSDRCGELDDVVLISGGNEVTDGNIQVYIRRGGEDVTLPLANRFHPEIGAPADRNPADAGCDDLHESVPQLIITNFAIAAAMLNAFYAHTQGRLGYDEAYIDILTNNSRSVVRSVRHAAA